MTVWADGSGLSTRGSQTKITRTVAKKRRLYRTYLGWATNNRLSGSVAEHVVSHVLTSLPSRVWPVESRPGQFNGFPNRDPFPWGPLDAGGYWPHLRGDPMSGLIPFAVEVKNLRSWIYPWSNELWQLLTKLDTFPDTIPVLIARRIHRYTFKFFKTVGAVGWSTRKQWFTNPGNSPDPRHKLTRQNLDRIATDLSFQDMTYIDLPPPPDEPEEKLATFFSDISYKRVDGVTVGPRSLELWSRAAPIIHRHSDLRDSKLPHVERRRTWAAFIHEMERAGLDPTGWATDD